MTTRSDLLMDFSQSPRVAVVRDPSTELTAQDMVDTLRKFEDSTSGITELKLIEASGKNNLGGGVKVGVTVEGQDTQVSFEGRTNTAQIGSVTTTDDVLVANKLTLHDATASFITNEIKRGSLVINFTDQSIAEVYSVKSEIELLVQAPVNGINNDFSLGDFYHVYNVVQCELSGGNIVAVDGNGFELSPVVPTAFTQVVRTASSSATQTDLEAIQYSSYQNAVWLDVVKGLSGTAFPAGTREYPSNNVNDSVSIAQNKGFDTIQFMHDLELGAGHDVSGMHLIGNGKSKSLLTILPEALTADCHVKECTVTGTMDGNSEFSFCSVMDIHYVNGTMYKCLLEPGTIILDNNSIMHALECDSGIPGESTPIINMGGSGQGLGMRGYDGGIKLINKTGPEAVSIDLSSGQVKIDTATVINGTIVVRGVGKVIEATTGENMPSGLWGNMVLLNETINGIQQYEMWQMMGLDIDAPIDGETPGEVTVGNMKQNITDNGDGTGTVTREF